MPRSWHISPLLVALLAAACSAPAAPFELTRAEQLEHDGDDAKALVAYDAAAARCRPGAERPLKRKDRARWCARVLLGRASALERLDRLEEAAIAYEQVALLATTTPDVPHPAAAAGLVDAGRLRLDLGQIEKAYSLFWAAILVYPDEAVSDEALRAIVRDGRARDAGLLYVGLTDAFVRLRDTEIADNLLVALADLAQTELGDPGAAIDVYDRLAADYPKSPLFDEALWKAANLARGQGDAAGAMRRLRALLATRDWAFLVGSNHSVYLDDGQLLAGVIRRDDQGDPRGALGEFGLVEKHYPDSILRDDALWEMAVTYDRLGDEVARCRTLVKLRAKYPDSKYLIELGSEACPE